ncbi:acetylxylan esterase [Candidatus Aerophobetes bacterium]|nr:acetylxylan esterase [Candidatus Aerophobetes bacterium]
MGEFLNSMEWYYLSREKEIIPELSFRGGGRKEFKEWHKKLEFKLKELLGDFPERVPLDPDKLGEEDGGEFIREKYTIATEKNVRVPLYLLKPKNIPEGKKLPAILCCHGHGPFGKDSVAGVTFNQSEREKNIRAHNYNYGEKMAKRGYITICPDFRPFGERVAYTEPFPGRDKCNVYFIKGLLLGEVLLAKNIYDGMRVIDFLCEQKEVNPQRIGCMGLSFGGTMTTYISALDERIKAADIICYLTTTRHYAIETANFCGAQFVPHLYKYADVADIAGLIAPRPLLVESGVNDTCFKFEFSRKAHQHLKKIYESAGALDKLEFEIFMGEHSFAGNKAFSFFDKYLKG